VIIQPDNHLYQNGHYYWTPERSLASWTRCFNELTATLSTARYRQVLMLIGIPGSGKSTWAAAHDAPDTIIFDGTFVDSLRRQRVIAAAASHHIPVIAIWLDTDLQTCIQRNQQRPPDRQVPTDSISTMLQRLHTSPPTPEEGFTHIYRLSA
jgi:predicted kinase